MDFQSASLVTQVPEIPRESCLDQNYPNPYNPTTVIRYQLPAASQAKLGVYDLLGRPVRQISEDYRSAGYHSTAWDGLNDLGNPVRKGSYVIGIFAPGSVAQHKVTVF